MIVTKPNSKIQLLKEKKQEKKKKMTTVNVNLECNHRRWKCCSFCRACTSLYDVHHPPSWKMRRTMNLSINNRNEDGDQVQNWNNAFSTLGAWVRSVMWKLLHWTIKAFVYLHRVCLCCPDVHLYGCSDSEQQLWHCGVGMSKILKSGAWLHL